MGLGIPRRQQILGLHHQRPSPVNFVIVEQDVLIGHAKVNQRSIEHAGEFYKVYGLSAMFTYPAFCHEGYGQQVAKAATDYILASDADVGMLFCLPQLTAFYTSIGWVSMETMQITHGLNDDLCLNEGEITMCMFLSEKGKQVRAAFEQHSVYVGHHIW